MEDGKIVNATLPVISAQCLRVACSDGHMAAVSVSFKKKPTIEQIKERWANYETEAQRLELPSAPKPFLQYFEDPSRPQTRLDRDFQNGFGVSIGRLREDKLFDYRFVFEKQDRSVAGSQASVYFSLRPFEDFRRNKSLQCLFRDLPKSFMVLA